MTAAEYPWRKSHRPAGEVHVVSDLALDGLATVTVGGLDGGAAAGLYPAACRD